MRISNRSSAHKAVMEKIVAIFNAGDLSDGDLIFSADSIDHQRPPDMEINGPDVFRQIVMNIRQSARDLKVAIEDLIGEGIRSRGGYGGISLIQLVQKLAEKQSIFFVLKMVK